MLKVSDIRRQWKRDNQNQTLTMVFIWCGFFMFGLVCGSFIPTSQDCVTTPRSEIPNQIRSN